MRRKLRKNQKRRRAVFLLLVPATIISLIFHLVSSQKVENGCYVRFGRTDGSLESQAFVKGADQAQIYQEYFHKAKERKTTLSVACN